MHTFVALLRGINVGKAKRVPMADLRALLTGLGFSDVRTLLNSGNAVFGAAGGTPAEHAQAIQRALATQMSVDAPVIVIAAAQLHAIAKGNPVDMQHADPSQVLVAFVQDPGALAALHPIEALVQPPEQFVVGGQAAYLHCAGGILESRAGKALLGKAGQATTTRNWATVLKLRALAQGGADGDH